MLSKKNKLKTNQDFGIEFNNQLKNNTLVIKKEDIEKSIHAINMLCEYIRYSYFDFYEEYTPNKLEKYCTKLLKYEKCNQSKLVQHCKKASNKILNNAIDHYYTIQSINLSLIFSNSNFETTNKLANQLMINSCGTYIRGIHD